MRFRCPPCNVELKAKPEQAGKRVRCPKCETVVTVPAKIGMQSEAALYAQTSAPDVARGVGVCPLCESACQPS